MKSIKELNQKAWYRLLKVIYLSFFLGIFIFSNWANIGISSQKVDQKDSIIDCKLNNKKILISNIENIEVKSYFYDSEYLSDNDIEKILIYCYGIDYTGYINDKNIEGTEKDTLIDSSSNSRIDSLSLRLAKKLTDFEKRDSFTIEYAHSYNDLVIYFLVINLSIILLFEAIKRIFYYVVLGKIRPDKE